jgi:hypothetical protein
MAKARARASARPPPDESTIRMRPDCAAQCLKTGGLGAARAARDSRVKNLREGLIDARRACGLKWRSKLEVLTLT